MKRTLIGLAGRAGAGKSTVADYLTTELCSNSGKSLLYTNPWAYILSILFGYGYDVLSTKIPATRDLSKVRQACQSLSDFAIDKKFELVIQALQRLHPQIETIIKMEFTAPNPRIIKPSDKFVEISFAEPLKMICVPICGLSYDVLLGSTVDNRALREQPISDLSIPNYPNISGRQLIEIVGTDCFRAIDPNFWINVAIIRVNQYLIRNISVVISDCRFKNEADMIHSLGGHILVIARDEQDLVLTQYDRTTHVSKWEFLTFINKKQDIVIINNSTIEALQRNVDLALMSHVV